MQDAVKLLITFPHETNIHEIAEHLRSDYVFTQEVKIVSSHQISLSFETMADLLDVDFVNTFGAISTRVINSSSFSQLLNLQPQNQIPDEENLELSVSFCSFSRESSPLNQTIMPHLPHRIERLTSLEDEVVEEQKLRKYFAVYQSNENGVNWDDNEKLEEEVNKLEESTDTRNSLESKEQLLAVEPENRWLPVIGGLALTTMLVGGFKLMRMVLG